MGLNQLTILEDETMAFGIVAGSIVVVIGICFAIYKICIEDDLEEGYSPLANDVTTHDVPRDFLNDEESLRHLADTYDFTHLSPEEQGAYLKGKEFSQQNPPNYHHARGKSFTAEDDAIIEDKGINAYYFDQDDSGNPRFIVGDRTDIDFSNNDSPYSTATAVLNYALPVKNRSYSDTVYFETKIFEYIDNPNSHFSIGLVTKPYPNAFRLPGYNSFSIGYESTGNLKINKPFPTPLQQHQGERSEYNALVLPPLSQSDVVGFGYVVSTGTIFITRNGKKVLDVMKGCFVDMFPAVGCFSTNAKFQVNLGQLGFVWIEANVRKYGFVSTSDYKKLQGERGLAALPDYDNADTDKILDKGEDLPPKYPDEEIDFFGRSIVRGSSSKQFRSRHQPPFGNFDSEKEEIDNEEEKDDLKPPKSKITHDPEEIMDLRERIYEQNVQNNNEFTPLMGNTPDYASTLNKDLKSQDKVKDSVEVGSSLQNEIAADQPDQVNQAVNLVDSDEVGSSVQNEIAANQSDQITNAANSIDSDEVRSTVENEIQENESNSISNAVNLVDSDEVDGSIDHEIEDDQQSKQTDASNESAAPAPKLSETQSHDVVPKSEEASSGSKPNTVEEPSSEAIAESNAQPTVNEPEINASETIPKYPDATTNVDQSTVIVAEGSTTVNEDNTQTLPDANDTPSSKEVSPTTSATKKKKKNSKKKKKGKKK